MWARSILAALLVAGAVCAAVVAEAGFAAQRGEAEIRALLEARAKGAQDTTIAPQALRVVAGLEKSWAAPLAWHAGAQEARAWAVADLPVADASVRRADAARWTARAVSSSPIHPAGWLRLAALGEAAAAANAPCASPQDCVETSFAAAPMGLYTAQSLACRRLDLATRLGVVRTAADVRLGIVMREQPNLAEAARCIGGLPAAELYPALAQAHRP